MNLDTPLQVSEAITFINEIFEQALPLMIIEGEVASFKVNQGKFAFFDVKDEQGSLNCFMMAFALKFPIDDGMKVRVLAQPKITNWGKFSLTVREVMPVGEGSLKKAFELLKAKLESEGLFDASRKRPLPTVPQRIGVVSSSQAAGYKDFLKILENRWGGLEITLVDVPVQGIDAPQQIIGAIEHLNTLGQPVDVIALVRGGGSADDLSVFNREDVVRAVAASRTPVIAGVGHEVDISLCDLAADRRAATPSNAAEIVVPSKTEVLSRANRLSEMAHNGVTAAIRVFSEDRLEVRFETERAVERFFAASSEKLQASQRTLHQLNPQTVLRRGYSLVQKGSSVISKKADVILGDEISVQFQDGSVGAKVIDVSS